MNGESHKGYTKASVLDKTDWRRTIHQCLEHCVNTMGTLEFRRSVKSLKSAVSARYPGFDAESLIEEMEKLIDMKYDLIKKIWSIQNLNAHWWDKRIKFAEYNIQKDEEMFVYIKNLLAEKRILLYGIKETIGGDQMDLPGVQDE